MAADERDSERGFKVQDRRRFDSSGEAREEATESAPEPAAAPADADEHHHDHEHDHHDHDHGHGHPHDHDHDHDAGEPAEITFATFVISLSAQALALLGEIPDPVEHSTHVDLEGARQIIDILGVLRDKTQGNLDAGESSLLDSALYDLRMKYVDRAHGR